MPTEITVTAIDRSTFVIDVSFANEDGVTMTPNSGLTWTLTDALGNVINEREDVAIASSSTVTVVLSGDDIAYADGYDRVFTIEGTYDSDLGSGLPVKDQAYFKISDLVAV